MLFNFRFLIHPGYCVWPIITLQPTHYINLPLVSKPNMLHAGKQHTTLVYKYIILEVIAADTPVIS